MCDVEEDQNCGQEQEADDLDAPVRGHGREGTCAGLVVGSLGLGFARARFRVSLG